MALCRFSDYQCDLYIYISAEGIQCHVAARRYENEPKPPDCPADADDEAWVQFWRDYGAYSTKIEIARLFPINLPADGQARTFDDWIEVLAYVLHLRAIGYQVPDWVIDSIKEEAPATVD